MDTDVGALITVDMHGYFGNRLQFFARGQLVALHLRPDDVIGFAGGHALRELASMIGIELPTRFLLAGPPNLHLDRIERMPVGVPNCSEDERVGLLLLIVTASRQRRS